VYVDIKPEFSQDALFDHAHEKLSRSGGQRGVIAVNRAVSLIGSAVKNLDQVVNIVDGLVEVRARYTGIPILLKAFLDTSHV
jgi:hypothetical protein